METNVTTIFSMDLEEVNSTSGNTFTNWTSETRTMDWSTEPNPIFENITDSTDFTTELSNFTFATLSPAMNNDNATSSWSWKDKVGLGSAASNWTDEMKNLTLPFTSPNLNNQFKHNTHNSSGDATHHGGYQPPGAVEAAVIVCIVLFILVVVAKYLGCNFCVCCSATEPRSEHQAQRTRIQNVLHRPEYNRPLQYAVYSRPTTAHIHQIHTADARGYGYAGEDDEEEQAKVFTRRDDNIIDPPPEYNSLVPPSYTTAYNYYTYNNSTNSANNVGDVQL